MNHIVLLGKVQRSSHWAGLYEVTRDAQPIYCELDVNGFIVCAGFSGHGFMHGRISGKLMAEKILGGKFSSVDVSILVVKRFEKGRLIQEYNVV
jgi:sarcosine oxidase, subunit beta